MTETNKLILKLISENTSIEEICCILNLTRKQLHYRLRKLQEIGYDIKANYSYSGTIIYNLKNDFIEDLLSLKIQDINNSFKCLVISDTHFGSDLSNYKYINLVYDYAIKNNIHIILFCGDILEGIYARKSNYTSISQIQEFIKKYPYDKKILNIGILGNHEGHFLKYEGIDVKKMISNARWDIVPINYETGIIKVQDDSILLYHNIKNKYPFKTHGCSLALLGHSHFMKVSFSPILSISVPTLSNDFPTKNILDKPSFLEINISLNKRKIDNIEIKLLSIEENKIFKCSESNYELSKILVREKN